MGKNDNPTRVAGNNPMVDLGKLRRNLEAIDSLAKQGVPVKGQHRLSQPFVRKNGASAQDKGQQKAKPVSSR